MSGLAQSSSTRPIFGRIIIAVSFAVASPTSRGRVAQPSSTRPIFGRTIIVVSFAVASPTSRGRLLPSWLAVLRRVPHAVLWMLEPSASALSRVTSRRMSSGDPECQVASRRDPSPPHTAPPAAALAALPPRRAATHRAVGSLARPSSRRAGCARTSRRPPIFFPHASGLPPPQDLLISSCWTGAAARCAPGGVSAVHQEVSRLPSRHPQ